MNALPVRVATEAELEFDRQVDALAQTGMPERLDLRDSCFRALRRPPGHRPRRRGWPGWHPARVSALDSFNEQPPDRAVEALRACNAAPRFAAEVAAGRPYPDADTLVARAEEVARSLPWDEVRLALAAHPRIGDRVQGSSSEAQASRREQSSMSGADEDTRAALVDGNRAYEELSLIHI